MQLECAKVLFMGFFLFQVDLEKNKQINKPVNKQVNCYSKDTQASDAQNTVSTMLSICWDVPSKTVPTFILLLFNLRRLLHFSV